MKLSEAIEVFLRFKSKELSFRTLKEYRSDLEMFKRVVGDKKVKSIRYSDIMLFRSSMDCSASLINRRISAVSSFFRFLVDAEVVESNPVKSSLRIRRVQQKVPDALTQEEARKLLEVARKKSRRDYLMVKVLLYSGLRVSELLSLSKDSIVKVRGRAVLRVLGKGG